MQTSSLLAHHLLSQWLLLLVLAGGEKEVSIWMQVFHVCY